MLRYTLTFRSKKKTKIIVFVNLGIFENFRNKEILQFFGIYENCATLALEKWHYYKTK